MCLKPARYNSSAPLLWSLDFNVNPINMGLPFAHTWPTLRPAHREGPFLPGGRARRNRVRPFARDHLRNTGGKLGVPLG